MTNKERLSGWNVRVVDGVKNEEDTSRPPAGRQLSRSTLEIRGRFVLGLIRDVTDQFEANAVIELDNEIWDSVANFDIPVDESLDNSRIFSLVLEKNNKSVSDTKHIKLSYIVDEDEEVIIVGVKKCCTASIDDLLEEYLVADDNKSVENAKKTGEWITADFGVSLLKTILKEEDKIPKTIYVTKEQYSSIANLRHKMPQRKFETGKTSSLFIKCSDDKSLPAISIWFSLSSFLPKPQNIVTMYFCP